MDRETLNGLDRRGLEAEARLRGYKPDPDDTDEELRSYIQCNQRRAAA